MPWTTDDPPSVATNWTDEEKRKCVEAANAVLREGGEDEQAIFACIRAAGRSEASMSHFLFTELAEDALTDGRAFDGVAFGTFRDMLGREITLEADDAADYVANTVAAIEATRGESGELAGLPIDANGHEKGDGAGWIVGAELVNGVIRLLPKWTEIGRELIGKRIRRFFSATIDVSNKVILGGTLTNWPATRDENNRLMLRPIELESNLYMVQEPEQVEPAPLVSEEANMADEEKQDKGEAPAVQVEQPVQTEPPRPAERELSPVVTADLMAEFADAASREPQELAVAVQRRADRIAENRVREMLERREQDWQITQLAAHYTGGAKFGLPVTVVELTNFLGSLGPEQFRVAQALFDRITTNGLVEFQEIGHGRRLLKKPLPEEYHDSLKRTLAAGNSVASFFEAVDLGDPGKYDLSQFEEN